MRLSDPQYVGSTTLLNDALEDAWREQAFEDDHRSELVGDDLLENLGWPEPRKFVGSQIGGQVALKYIMFPSNADHPDKASWDATSYMIVMNHNVETFLRTMLA